MTSPENSAETTSLNAWEFEEEEREQVWPAPLANSGPVRPLSELPPGPWRSLGRVLDYTFWADRDRFLELDRAIEVYDRELKCTQMRYPKTVTQFPSAA